MTHVQQQDSARVNPMAPSYPQVVEQADSLYAAETVLTMAGAWQAGAGVSLQGKIACIRGIAPQERT